MCICLSLWPMSCLRLTRLRVAAATNPMAEARGLHTGEDAVTFFSKYSTVGDCPVKFLHLNRAPAQVCQVSTVHTFALLT
jgi:hypothetical protein